MFISPTLPSLSFNSYLSSYDISSTALAAQFPYKTFVRSFVKAFRKFKENMESERIAWHLPSQN